MYKYIRHSFLLIFICLNPLFSFSETVAEYSFHTRSGWHSTVAAACSAEMGFAGPEYAMTRTEGIVCYYSYEGSAESIFGMATVRQREIIPDPSATDRQRCSDASAINNSTLGIPYEEVTINGSVSSDTSVCLGTSGLSSPAVGCTVNFNLDIGYTKPDGSWVSRGTVDTQGAYVSLPCSLETADLTKPPKSEVAKCPVGQQMGQINGLDSCQPYGPAVTSKTKDSTETKTGPEGTETIETETSCTGNKCSTTSTSASGSSHTTTSTKDSYCQKNPTSSQCGGASSGGSGSGDGGEDGDCTPGNDLLKCAKFGNAGGSDPQLANTNKPMTISSDTGWGPSTGSCPAPRPINLSFGTINMPFDLLCQFADGIRPLVLGLAYLGAAFTFFGIGRKT